MAQRGSITGSDAAFWRYRGSRGAPSVARALLQSAPMWRRIVCGVVLLQLAIACGTSESNECGGSLAGGGSGNAAGASGHAESGAGGGALGGTGGELGGDAGAGGEAGTGGAAGVQFWTDATQHIEIACFGFGLGYAQFRAERAQLSVEQLTLLARQTGLPGSTDDSNDDGIHCLVTTRDAQARQRVFTIGRPSELIADEPSLGEGGAAGTNGDGSFRTTLLGCEFRSEAPEEVLGGRPPPLSANPLCVRELSPDGKVSTFAFDLAQANRPYHLQFVDCAGQSFANVKVELFGADPSTPLAVGAAPAEPGADQSCLELDAQVAAPAVARLVFTSPSLYERTHWVVLR